MKEYKSVLFKGAIDKEQVFITPAIGVIDERRYYGYPVFSIAVAWLKWRCKIAFGVKKWRPDND